MPEETRITFENRLRYKMAPSILNVVMDAYKFAKYGHRTQTRDDGTRYFDHPRRVALILIDELGIYDHEMIIAALLHDIEEDSFILTLDRIQKDFGDRVLGFIKLLTKQPGQKVENYLSALQQAEEAAQIIKLCDRLDNIRDLNGCPRPKVRKQLQETLTHFLPWAGRINPVIMKKMQDACALAQQNFLP